MKPEQDPSPQDTKDPAERESAVTTLRRPVPWDITDEEIEEWKHSRSGEPGRCFAGYIAAAIRDGRYDDGKELLPLGSVVYREISRATVDLAMGMLMDRGMVRKSGNAWYPAVPGRLTPTARRAIAFLLASREQLPPTLATELDSYKATLDTWHPDTPAAKPATQPLAQKSPAQRTLKPTG